LELALVPRLMRRYSRRMNAENENARVVAAEDSGLELTERGDWLHRGEPVENAKIATFFHRAIRKDDQGDYYLWNAFDGKQERVYFRVADTAYFVRHLALDEQRLHLQASLNTGAAVAVDPDSFEQDARGGMTCRVLDGDRARLTTNALHDLSELVEEDADGIHLQLGGRRVTLVRS
jgi:hypothetical protein